MVFIDPDIALLFHIVDKGPLHLLPGEIISMDNPPPGMASFPSEI